MKTIGLIGGMSFDSTIEYYKIINTEIRKKLGGNSCGKILLHSMNFQEIVDLQFSGEWEKLGLMLADAAVKLEKDGADCILICTNLMHKVAPYVEDRISVPLIHIADVTAENINKLNLEKVLLLGTCFTMEEDFYKTRLENHGIETIVPDDEDRAEVIRVIYEELCQSIISDKSRQKYENIIEKMRDQGAQGVVLGCTEIPLLIKDTVIPAFNTTKLHAMAAVEFALSDEKAPALMG